MHHTVAEKSTAKCAPWRPGAKKTSRAGTPFALALTGTVVATTDTTLKLKVSVLQAFPMNVTLKGLAQPLTLSVPATAVVQQRNVAPPTRLLACRKSEPRLVRLVQMREELFRRSRIAGADSIKHTLKKINDVTP